MAEIFIHQIFYDEASRAKLLPGFLPLDNTRNERPDWFEFPLILGFLRHNRLRDHAWYGLVSPKFHQKTGMDATRVIQKIQAEGRNADVLVLALAWNQVAFFLNPCKERFASLTWAPGNSRVKTNNFATKPPRSWRCLGKCATVLITNYLACMALSRRVFLKSSLIPLKTHIPLSKS